MPLKRSNNYHYTICNSQVQSNSRFALKGVGRTHCNCLELELEEKIRSGRAASTTINMSNIPFYETKAVPYLNIDTDNDLFFASNLKVKTMNLNRFEIEAWDGEDINQEVKLKSKYKKEEITYFRIIEKALLYLESEVNDLSINRVYNLSFLSKANFKSWDAFKYRLSDMYDFYRSKLDPSMIKPELKLVRVGMDIDVRHLTSNSFVIKPLKGTSRFSGHIIRKDSYWVLSDISPKTPPFQLFEFPISDGLLPTTELSLFVDPYTPEIEECFLDIIYKGYGITLMKKFEIKDARKLLDRRRHLFDSAPTATNTILLFQLMDAIILNDFKTGVLDIDGTGEKNLVRLDKLKNLALSTNFNEERRNAVQKCFLQYDIICAKVNEKVE